MSPGGALEHGSHALARSQELSSDDAPEEPGDGWLAGLCAYIEPVRNAMQCGAVRTQCRYVV
jgi:hypothetical protein